MITENDVNKERFTYEAVAYDDQGHRRAIFTPLYEGSFQEALTWFASRDFITGDPYIESFTIRKLS